MPARIPACPTVPGCRPCPPARLSHTLPSTPPLTPGPFRLGLTQDGEALCLLVCGITTCAAVSAAVQAPHYVRHRTALAIGVRLLCAWAANSIIATMLGPVQDVKGWPDFALRRVATGGLSLLALGARLGPRASLGLLLAQGSLLLATQRAACGDASLGWLHIHPNFGDYLRPTAAVLSACTSWVSAAARPVLAWAPPPAALPACDAASCWAVVAWTDAAVLTLCTAAGMALAGEVGTKWRRGEVLTWAMAAVVGLAAYWRLLEAAAPLAVPCGGG